MSTKYRFGDQKNLHFITCTAINWIDLFIREEYRTIIVDSIKFCQKNKGLEVYGYCLMTSHFHMIMGSSGRFPQESIVRDFKAHTSGKIHELLKSPIFMQESRKEWMYKIMKSEGLRNSNNHDFQFWQQSNHPVELWSPPVFDQKLEYIHMNPVEAGFVETPEDWKYSSAVNYAGKKGVIDILYA